MHTILCILIEIHISENKDGKKSEGSYLSCVTNGELYFTYPLIISVVNQGLLQSADNFSLHGVRISLQLYNVKKFIKPCCKGGLISERFSV